MPASIFDAHVHVWGDDRVAYPQVPGRERPDSHLGSADLLVQLMDQAGVQHALLVQTPWYGEDNRYLVDAMRRFPGRFAALGYLEDPLAHDAPERLVRQTEADGFHGVRLHLTIEPVHAGVAAGQAEPLFRQAQALGVPVQFLNRVPAHPTILAVARRFPDLTLVVDHLGHPDPADAPDFASSAPFFALAEHPNVYVKVSNHDLHSRAPFPWPDLFDYQRRVVDAFGPRRLMWGSNWPMRHPALSYAARLDGVRHHLPAFLTLSENDRAWMLGETALSLWQPQR